MIRQGLDGHLANLIMRFRNDISLSQAGLADAVGCSRSCIGHIETCRRRLTDKNFGVLLGVFRTYGLDEAKLSLLDTAWHEVNRVETGAPRLWMESGTMRLRVEEFQLDSDAAFMRLSGDLVLGEDSTGKLRGRLENRISEGYTRVFVDVGGLRRLDAAGIGTLVRAYAEGRTEGTWIQLRNLTPTVHQLLALTKLLTVFWSAPPAKAA